METPITTEQTPSFVCTTPHTATPFSSIGSTPGRKVGSCRKSVSHGLDMETPVNIEALKKVPAQLHKQHHLSPIALHLVQPLCPHVNHLVLM